MLKDVSESTRPIWKLILEKLDLPTSLLQLYDSNGIPVTQDENTGEINETRPSNIINASTRW